MAKLVFCEDEERIKKLILAMLDVTPHEVFIASDGHESLELIEREHPDLVFVDISMPGRDGFQVADELKSRSHLAGIPLVFLTAFAQRTEREEAFRHGASDYLTKPFHMVDLLNSIEKFVPEERRKPTQEKNDTPACTE